MKRKIITLIFAVLLQQLTAQTVDMATIINVARNIQTLESPTMLRSAGEIKITSLQGDGIEPLVHIIEYAEGGFSIISGDKRAPAVLGHTRYGSFDPENLPPGLLFLIERYKAEIQELIEFDIQPEEEVINEWRQLSSSELPTFLISSSSHYVDRDILLTTRWNQRGGRAFVDGALSNITFNHFTPGNGPAGCVAVAIAQILRFWGCKVAPAGERRGINFGNTVYHWTRMSDTHADIYNARLIHHAGISANTLYTSSFAMSLPGPARDGFVDHWGICSSAILRWRMWNPFRWRRLLREEIQAGRPVFYSALDMWTNDDDEEKGGHAWVIDGYWNRLFHVNWGWGGNANGWFSLGDFNPRDDWDDSAIGRFNQMENAIFGIVPRAKVDFNNQTVAENKTVSRCGDINTQNIIVTNGATLTLHAEGDINLQHLTVTNNSRLILYAGGRVNLGVGFRVEPGSSFLMR